MRSYDAPGVLNWFQALSRERILVSTGLTRTCRIELTEAYEGMREKIEKRRQSEGRQGSQPLCEHNGHS